MYNIERETRKLVDWVANNGLCRKLCSSAVSTIGVAGLDFVFVHKPTVRLVSLEILMLKNLKISNILPQQMI